MPYIVQSPIHDHYLGTVEARSGTHGKIILPGWVRREGDATVYGTKAEAEMAASKCSLEANALYRPNTHKTLVS